MNKTIPIVIAILALLGILGFQQWQIQKLNADKLDKKVDITIFSEGKETPLEMRSFAETIVNMVYENQKANQLKAE
jgi:hypothetical protein